MYIERSSGRHQHMTPCLPYKINQNALTSRGCKSARHCTVVKIIGTKRRDCSRTVDADSTLSIWVPPLAWVASVVYCGMAIKVCGWRRLSRERECRAVFRSLWPGLHPHPHTAIRQKEYPWNTDCSISSAGAAGT